MTHSITADLCIIGAGSAGLSLAAGAAQLGRKTVLIEKGEMGGDCLNYGCVPSKALLAAGAAAQSARDASKFGVNAGEPEIDFPAVMDHVDSVIAAIAPHDSQERFEGFGVTVIRERGMLTGPRTVKAGDYEITAKHIILATGSSPFVPPIPGIDQVDYFTNETIFKNRNRPDHLLVLGGGPIGIEMAQAHRRLGSEVTVVEGFNILGRDDKDAVALVRARLEKEGVNIVEGVKATAVSTSDTGGVTLTLDSGETISGSHLLVAVGRRSKLDGLGLEAAGVTVENGRIISDDRLRTANSRVYVAGDIAGGAQFTHLAGDHASTLVRNILFKMPAKKRDALIPRVTYCEPELASVGISEDEARKAHGDDVTVLRWDLTENDRAQAEKGTEGFIKVVTNKKGVVLGATIVGKSAGDLISMWAFALANGSKVKDFTNFIAPYPTRGEISKRAAGAFYTPTLFSDRTKTVVRLLAMFD